MHHNPNRSECKSIRIRIQIVQNPNLSESQSVSFWIHLNRNLSEFESLRFRMCSKRFPTRSRTSSVPSLYEFSIFICDEAEEHGAESLDPHFRPQWLVCPHCDLRFDAIAKLENIVKDQRAFVKPLKLWVSKETELERK